MKIDPSNLRPPSRNCFLLYYCVQISPLTSPRASIGQLSVEVVQASGKLFESGKRHRVRLTVAHSSFQTKLRKHPLAASKKPLVWKEKFDFPIGLPTDFLSVALIRGADVEEAQVGSLIIALAHLPQATPTLKWYELKSGSESVAVVQLRLCYTLTYSIHRRDATSSLTIVPSQAAREFLRRELFKYARNSKLNYRFLCYFLTVGVEHPTASSVPTVLDRYPAVNRPDFTIPSQIESFCFPSGFALSHTKRKPIVFSFRLSNQTELHTDQTVAAVLCFWEKRVIPASDSVSESEDEVTSLKPSPPKEPSDSGNIGNIPITEEPERSSSSRSQTYTNHITDEECMIAEAAAAAAAVVAARGSRTGSAARKSASFIPNSSASSAAYKLQPPSNGNASASPLSKSNSRDSLSPSPPPVSASAPPLVTPLTASSSFSSSLSSVANMAQPESISEHPNTIAESGSAPSEDSNTSDEEHLVTVYVPKCFVFLTRLSFAPTMKDMLVTLWQHYFSEGDGDMPDVAPAAASMHEEASSSTATSSCPICVDALSSARTCQMATETVEHHNAALNGETITLSHLPSTSTTFPAFAIAVSEPDAGHANSNSSADQQQNQSSLSKSNSSSSSNLNLNMSSLPPTPASTSTQQFSPLTPALPNHPDTPFLATGAASGLIPSSHSNSPFNLPPSATSPHGGSTNAITCNQTCCPCSCCTERVDCNGLTFEQYIMYLCDEVPLPLPGATSVEITVCCKKYEISLPASELDFPHLEFILDNPATYLPATAISSLPAVAAAMSHMAVSATSPSATALSHRVHSSMGLFQTLDFDVILLILRCILCEMKIIFHSNSLSLLHSVSESLIALCFPFQWSHIYIPLLPSELYGMLEAPVSFIVGVESKGMPKIEEMLGVNIARDNGRLHQQSSSLHSDAVVMDSVAGMNGTTPAASTDEYERTVTQAYGRGGVGNSASSSPNQPMHLHDLSNFAFVDIDRGVVDLTVPPPPFPTSAQKTLVDNIRRLTKPQIFSHDEVPPAHSHWTPKKGSAADIAAATDASPNANGSEHVGSNFHLHYHPSEFHSSSFAHPMVSSKLPSAAGGAGDEESSNPTSVALQQLRMHNRAIRTEFLSFLASLITSYRDYLFFVGGATPVFDTPSFLSGKGRSEALPFLSRFLESQVFRDFLDRHVEFPSYLQDYLLYINSHPHSVQTRTILPLGGETTTNQAQATLAVPEVTSSSRSRGRTDMDYSRMMPPTVETHSHSDGTALDGSGDSQSKSLQVFRVPLPKVLTQAQWYQLLNYKNCFYQRLINAHPHRIVSDTHASTSVNGTGPMYLRNSAECCSVGWRSNLPSLGMLATGALAPDLPIKLRSRSNSLVGGKLLQPNGVTESSSEHTSPDTVSRHLEVPNSMDSPAHGGKPFLQPLRINATPATSTGSVPPTPTAFRSSLFPFTGRYVVPLPARVMSHGEEANLLCLGKNPSTLNHTLLFSKMYDGISSSLSEQASAQASRVTTPGTHPSRELNLSAENMMKKGGLLPMDISSSFTENQGHTPSTSAHGSSIFLNAFASLSPLSADGGTVPIPNLDFSIPHGGHTRQDSMSYIQAASTSSSTTTSPKHAVDSPSHLNSVNPSVSRPFALHVPDVAASPRDVVPIHPQSMPAASLAMHPRSHSTQLPRNAVPPLQPTLQSSHSTIASSSHATNNNAKSGGPNSARSFLHSTRPRQMSLNLLSKSEFEKKKRPIDSRLGQVISMLMTPRASWSAASPAGSPNPAAALENNPPSALNPLAVSAGAAGSGGGGARRVDLGELSAVGELLSLNEWRVNFVKVFGEELGLNAESAAHRLLPTSSFLSLSLLFNIALEECHLDRDFLTALSLLHISGKIYNFPGHELIDPPPSQSNASLEREYLRTVLKKQALWREVDFWHTVYNVEVQHKLDNPQTPLFQSDSADPNSYSASIPSPASHPRTPRAPVLSAEDRESLVFELIAGLIYLQLSLGVSEELVRASVETCATDFHLSSEKQSTLRQLVTNIKRTTANSFEKQTNTPNSNQTPKENRPSDSSLTLQFPRDDADAD